MTQNSKTGIIIGLTNGTRYTFQVRIVNGQNGKRKGEELDEVSMIPTTKLDAPPIDREE